MRRTMTGFRHVRIVVQRRSGMASVSDLEAGVDRVVSVTPATLIVRVGARAVDVFVVLVVVVVGSLVPGGSETSTATAVSFGLVAVAVSVFEACLLRWWGRTPGMALFGLSVTTTTGRRVPLWRGMVRAAIVWSAVMLGGIVTGVAAAIILISTFGALIGPMIARTDHRGLHDLITATVVVRAI